MNYKKMALCSLLAVATSLSGTIAFATDDPILAAEPDFAASVSVPPITGDDPGLDAQCAALLNPSTSSGFTSIAVDVVEAVTSSVTVDLGLVSTVGIGPVTSVWSGFRGAHVNGQSVNIHAYGDYKVSYAGGAVQTYNTQTTTVYTKSGNCHTHKPTNGNTSDTLHPGYQIAPAGLQGGVVTSTRTVVTTGTRTVNIPGPWIDPNSSLQGAQVVICISPGRVPGNWRNQNGYNGSLGTCSRAWYDTLGSTPSVSLPNL
jgi:hypothetical protein